MDFDDDQHLFSDYNSSYELQGELDDYYDKNDQMFLQQEQYSHIHENQPNLTYSIDHSQNYSTDNFKCESSKSNKSMLDSFFRQQNQIFQHLFSNDDMKVNKQDSQSHQKSSVKYSDDAKLKSSSRDDRNEKCQNKVKLKDSEKSSDSFVTTIPHSLMSRQSTIKSNRRKKDFHPSVYSRAEQLLKAKYTIPQICKTLLLKLSQVRKLKAQFKKNGSLLSIKNQQHNFREASTRQKQNEVIKQLLKKQIDSNCSITLKYMQQTLKKHNIIRSRSTIHAILQKMKYSRKKIQKVPLERNSQNKLIYRQNYCKMMQQIALDKQIFLDQTIFGLQTSGHYGWAPKGEQPTVFVPASRRKHITLLAAISVKGFEATKLIKGPVTSRHICQFLQHYLDHLQPNEILILDNARMHHAAIVKEKIRQLNRPVRYIPAYTPQLNPIQNIFSEIKAAYVKLKENEDMKSQEMIDLVKEAIKNMRSKQFTKYYEHYEQWLRKGAAGELFI